ncbi:hypothetical protein GCM10027413_15780 [Conyzicola nivalis]|uniref:DUF4190 domain-containing protein n=1 Tax=Conyzicola nivalis TaxID=1477021 RepID=A0A916WGC2_9MICO|nr:DUF4190 domain-containing protein [Conyzicola nivalis]GGA98209.1 hypothetical protein GCM10010979_10840 [Conyzicola nivalis]
MTDTPALPAATAPSAAPTASPVYVESKNLSVIALVLGIASVLLGYTFIVPIAAIVVGVLGYRREPTGHTLAVWGIVLGAVMAFGWIVAGFFGVLFTLPFFFVGLF